MERAQRIESARRRIDHWDGWLLHRICDDRPREDPPSRVGSDITQGIAVSVRATSVKESGPSFFLYGTETT